MRATTTLWVDEPVGRVAEVSLFNQNVIKRRGQPGELRWVGGLLMEGSCPPTRVLPGLCANKLRHAALKAKEHIGSDETAPLPHPLTGNCFVCMFVGSRFFPVRKFLSNFFLQRCCPAVGNRRKLARKTASLGIKLRCSTSLGVFFFW